MESYGPVKGRCRKGYKKNKTTKMCDPIKEKSKSPQHLSKSKTKSKTKTKTTSKSKKLNSYGPVKGRCRKGYKKNKTTKMCDPIEQPKPKEIKDILEIKDKMSEDEGNPSNVPILSKNEAYIKALQELESLHKTIGDMFRARAYQKAAEAIIMYQKPITSLDEIKGLSGIGKTILEKLKELDETGSIKKLVSMRANPMNIFTKIYGVGPSKAKELVKKGITTLEQLRENKDELNTPQKLGLQYYEDLEKRIPRSEIQVFENIFKKQFNFEDTTLADGADFKIVGSYRRGLKSSGDIDVIITNNNNPSILKTFVNKLQEQGIILHKLAEGKRKCLVIGQLEKGKPARRLDFLYTPPTEYAFAILYFTGSALFNTVMRQRALDMNYTLNEHGFHTMIKGKKGKAIDDEFKTEKDIFDFLNLEYKRPEERINGSAVQSKVQDDSESLVIKSPSKKAIKSHKTTLKSKKITPLEHLKTFQKEGVKYLHKLTPDNLAEIIKFANDAYYNHESVITDNQYDIIKEYLESKSPNHKVLDEIGAPVEHKKVKLPYEMWSMDKIKPDTKALHKWITKYDKPKQYVVSAKLDGVSGLYVIKNGEKHLYTRGNGRVGQDISHLISYLQLPDLKEDLVIRGEFLISKANFKERFKGSSNARNTVSGIINRLSIEPEKLKYVDFVAYECIYPEIPSLEQMKFLEKLEVKCVLYKEIGDNTKYILSNEFLSALLVEWRKSYQYEIDGIIVAHNKIYPRKSGNPEHAFAFKMVLSDQIAEAKVLDVLWSASKDGFLKPRIRIEPVFLSGVKIEYATAFNAAFVEKNKLGIGAIVKIIRSGDVIPYIMDVVEPAPEPKMPDEDYIWNPTHIDIILRDSSNNIEVKFKQILAFFKTMDVGGLGPGNIKKIMDAGYDDVASILAMTPSDFLKVDGFKEKTAQKLFKNIDATIKNVSLPTLMKATNIFGRGLGEKKLEPILQAYPDILQSEESSQAKLDKLVKMKGLGEKTAKLFVDNIDTFKVFLVKAKLLYKLEEYIKTLKKIEKIEGPLSGKTVIMTGFRDKELVELIKKAGGKIGSSVSKSTFKVIVQDIEQDTDKANKARKLGILILEDDFRKQFL